MLSEIMEKWIEKVTGYTKIKHIAYLAGDYRFEGISPEGEIEQKVYCTHKKKLLDDFCDGSGNDD